MEQKLNESKFDTQNAARARQFFGNTQTLRLWVSPETVLQVSQQIKEDPELRLDWLEQLSLQKTEEEAVLTYFFRSSENKNTLVIKTKVRTQQDARVVRLPSIAPLFPMARSFEQEVARQAGFEFE